jgi:hypothetical protein
VSEKDPKPNCLVGIEPSLIVLRFGIKGTPPILESIKLITVFTEIPFDISTSC